MIIVKLQGGLGNQMFQYAAGLALANRNKCKLKLDCSWFNLSHKVTCLNPINNRIQKVDQLITPREFQLDIFELHNNFSKTEDIFFSENKGIKFSTIFKKFISQKKFRHYSESKFSFDQNFFKLKSPLTIEGYWQSEKYFFEIKNIILSAFKFRGEFSKENNIIFNKINSLNSISIHFRRGDYVYNSNVNKTHGICSMSYYNSAIKYVCDRVNSPYFFIFSDDIEWVKENIKIENATYVSNPNLSECEELMFMSYCKHNIIANSTFSWWGAWLNKNENKIVIAPQKWLNTNISKQPDIIPSTWLKI